MVCQYAGRCIDKDNTHQCMCQRGYMGSYCEREVDECLSNPCRNGGTCVDYQSGYDCKVQPISLINIDIHYCSKVWGKDNDIIKTFIFYFTSSFKCLFKESWGKKSITVSTKILSSTTVFNINKIINKKCFLSTKSPD